MHPLQSPGGSLNTTDRQTIEVPIRGMDCAECTLHVQQAIAALPGVESVNVFLSSERAVIRFNPALVDLPTIRKAVEGASYFALPAPSLPWERGKG